MKYPTSIEVEEAGQETLAKWSRFLPSPGMNHLNKNNFHELLDKERIIMARIIELFKETGGWNSALSKQIGWG
jgi:hypothetical protein